MQPTALQAQDYLRILDTVQKTRDFTVLSAAIRKAFGNPEILNQSFRLPHSFHYDQNYHNIDLSFLQKYYYDTAHNANLDPRLLPICMEQLINNIEVTCPQNKGKFLKAYFIISNYPEMYEEKNNILLLKFVLLMNSLSEEQRNMTVRWSQDIEVERLKFMIASLNRALTANIHKLLPGPHFQKLDHKGIATAILAFCRQLQVLYKSNCMKQRVDPVEFQNSDICKSFSPKDQIKLSLQNNKYLNFMEFPFLLSLQYKNKLLQVQTHFEHEASVNRGIANLVGGMIPQQAIIQQQLNLFNVIYLHFELHRSNILDESLQRLSKVKQGLKNPLKITFIGEPGDDGGGVRKEYFQLIMKQIFNPCRDMFVPKNNDRYYWFNGSSFQAPIMFEFVGMILGLAIYNTTLLELKFPKIIYKRLLAPENQEFDWLNEMTEVEPDYQKSFRYILDTKEALQGMFLYFEAETEVFGQKIKHQLKPHGDKIQVTQTNKVEYVRLHAEWIMAKSIQKQYKAFRRGFYKVVTGSVIKTFSASQLEKIICGDETLDFKELEKATKYESGFSAHTPIVRAFWQIAHSWDLQNKKAFLFFTTGSDRSPIGGLGKMKFTIERHGPDSDNLPTAHTCSNVFLLPEYTNKHKLKQKLQFALKYKEGFGLI